MNLSRQFLVAKSFMRRIKPNDILVGANKGDITAKELLYGKDRGDNLSIVTKNNNIDITEGKFL